MPTNSLSIGHFDTHYEIACNNGDVSGVHQRLDRVAGELLAQAWERQCALAGGSSLDGVYFIESLETELMLDLATADDRGVADAWAAALYQEIMRSLAQGGPHVRSFDTRAEYLAAFVADLIRGSAWGTWYYAAFEHLKDIGTGPLLVRVLTEEADTGRDALLILAARNENINLLLSSLSDAEVDTVVSRCLLPKSPDISSSEVRKTWAASLQPLLKRTSLCSVISRDLATLYLSLLRERPNLGPDVNLARFIQRLLLLRKSIQEVGDRSSAEIDFLQMLCSDGHVAPVNALEKSEDRIFLRSLLHEMDVREIATLLHETRIEQASISGSFVSRYGGIFLLMPAIVELDIYQLLEQNSYPDIEQMPKPGVFLYLAALQCLESRNQVDAIRDKGVSLFAGLERSINTAVLAAYEMKLTEKMHDDFEKAVREHLDPIGKNARMRQVQREHSDDAVWFSLRSSDGSLLQSDVWDQAIAVISQAMLRSFACRLGAFGESSPGYLCRNFLESRAEITVQENSIKVHFLSCPLQMVLRMAGFEGTSVRVPWLRNRMVEFSYA